MITCNNSYEYILLVEDFVRSAIKINQKIHLLKPPWLTPSLLSLRKLEIEESASSHVWDRKRKTTQGVFVLCLNSATVGGMGEPGEERIREKKFLTAAQPEAQNMCHFFRHRVTSHPSSPVIILPLKEHTRRLSGTKMHSNTTTHRLWCLDLLLNAASIRSSNNFNWM